MNDETLALANRIRESMESWVTRMAGSAGAGRSATSVARMATARAIADLRNVPAVEGDGEDSALVADYLRRSRSLLTQAAHDIERNRYSLQQMDAQMHRLDEVAKRIFPEAESDESEPAGDKSDSAPVVSGETAGSADDGRADREVASGENRPLQG
ncbi:MAG TPA: hypothetical protein VFO27_05925 [Bryobacteraceae bacterium]|nr:hypothetical protein [Bryobacteraceae bacterium]